MSRKKASRYTNALDEPMLIQAGKDFFDNCKGRRRSDYFHNDNPIVLELACGRGEYTVGLSQIYPEKNFIGVDIKAERMMVGIERLSSPQPPPTLTQSFAGEGISISKTQTKVHNDFLPGNGGTGENVSFLRTIIHHLDQFFAPGEVDEIWIVHPDPRPKNRDAKRRLTSARFLQMYHSILSENGLLRLKTDDEDLFAYSVGQLDSRQGDSPHKRELVAKTDDLYSSLLLADHHGIKTHYETMFVQQGRTIHYGVWRKR